MHNDNFPSAAYASLDAKAGAGDIHVASPACAYADYLLDPTCGHTRGALANWATRITQVHL